MNKDFARQQIQTLLEAAWAVMPPCTMVWENQPKKTAEPKDAYVQFSIEFGKTVPAAVGREFTRMPVTLRALAYLPVGAGTQKAVLAADRCDAAFQFADFKTTLTDGTSWTLNGDEGCLGPMGMGREGDYAVFRLTHALRIDEGRLTISPDVH